MKKFLVFIAIFAAMLLVSCGGDSKKENETPDSADTVSDKDGDTADSDSSDTEQGEKTDSDSGDTTQEQPDDANSQSDDDSGDSQNDDGSNSGNDSGDSTPYEDADTEPPLPECSATGEFPCKDSQTGLVWSALNDEEVKQELAAKYCEDMGNGWRLPNVDELRTLIQNCSSTISDAACKVTDPDCLTGNCANTACKGCGNDTSGIYSKLGDNDSLWSSSVQSDNADNGWVIGFNLANISSQYNRFQLGVRCVKGTYQHATGVCSPNPCYKVKYSTGVCIPEGSSYKCECDTNTTWNGSDCKMTECFTSIGTPCHDSATGLTWSKRNGSMQKYSDAESFCENLNEGGYTDWKVPNIDQLRSLVKNCDISKSGGSCKLSLKNNCLTSECLEGSCNQECSYDSSGNYSKFGDSAIFWSSTADPDVETSYWVINFYSAAFINNDQNSGGNDYAVRCVR